VTGNELHHDPSRGGQKQTGGADDDPPAYAGDTLLAGV
jgi:hypothetical protein